MKVGTGKQGAARKTRRKKKSPGAGRVFRKKMADKRRAQTLGRLGIQPTLKVGAVNDRYEQEADKVAELITGASGNETRANVGAMDGKGTPSRGREGNGPVKIQRKAGGAGFTVNNAVSREVKSMERSGGRRLPESERAYFEPRFGRDLSHVRVHDDKRAHGVSNAIQAKAFTVGNHIAFNEGHFRPGTHEGRRLLAHEITHTIQQTGGVKDTGGTRGASGGVANRDVIQRQAGGYSDKVLEKYLSLLDRTGKIEDKRDSDNKALAVAEKWIQGYSRYLLNAKRKTLIIRELYTGVVWPDEQSAVLALLKGATDRELHEIVNTLGQEFLISRTALIYQGQLNELLKRRKGAIEKKQGRAPGVFDGSNVMELRKRFTANALMPEQSRAKCIQILYDLAPRLFRMDKRRLDKGLGKVPVIAGERGWIMKIFGPRLRRMGLSSRQFKVRFEIEKEPDPAEPNKPFQKVLGYAGETPWDAIMNKVGKTQGWHIFGLAVHSGTHVQTVFVDNRADGPKLYLADQWNRPSDAEQNSGPGSAPGFRSYDKERFNGHLLFYTKRFNKNWGNRKWDTNLYIWKFNPAR